MSKDKVNAILLIGFVSLITSCKYIEKFDAIIKSKEQPVIEKKITKKRTISLACGVGTIKDYESKGWKVVNTEEREVPCTWKTEKASSKCNIDKDKGCRITVPDKMGKEYIYTIEKDSLVNLKRSKQ